MSEVKEPQKITHLDFIQDLVEVEPFLRIPVEYCVTKDGDGMTAVCYHGHYRRYRNNILATVFGEHYVDAYDAAKDVYFAAQKILLDDIRTYGLAMVARGKLREDFKTYEYDVKLKDVAKKDSSKRVFVPQESKWTNRLWQWSLCLWDNDKCDVILVGKETSLINARDKAKFHMDAQLDLFKNKVRKV